MTPPDISQLRRDKKLYQDQYFPPNQNSLFSMDEKGVYIDKKKGLDNQKNLDKNELVSNIEWKRMSQVKPKYVEKPYWEVFGDGKIRVNDAEQGQLGDCYFIGAITAIAEYPYLIAEKFRTREYNEEGFYEVILFIDGEWQIVFVDDWLPYDKRNDDLAFAKSNFNSLWPIILEKAWAKVNGGYSNIIAGDTCQPFFALTQFPTVKLTHKELTREQLIAELHKSEKEGTIRTASSNDEGTNKEASGIASDHIYSLLAVKAKDDLELIQLRNPWGTTEWKGDWSPESTKWTPELKEYFGEIRKNTGMFYIDIDDYLKYYESSNVCYLLFDADIKSYHFNDPKYYKHPLVFNIQIKETAQTAINIILNHWRFNRDIEDPVRPFSVVLGKYNDNKEIEELYAIGTTINDCTLIETLSPGNYILWIYCSYDYIQNDQFFKYTLSITSKASFNSKFIGLDKEFKVIKKLASSHYKYNNQNLIEESKKKDEGILVGEDEVLYKENVPGYIIYNTCDLWTTVTITLITTNIVLFPPYYNMKEITVELAPTQSVVILGFTLTNIYSDFRIDTSASFQEIDKDYPQEDQSINDLFFSNKTIDEDTAFANSIPSTEYRFVNKNVASHFSLSITNNSIKKESKEGEEQHQLLLKEFPKEMNMLMKLQKINDDVNVIWEKTVFGNGIYIGEVKLGTHDRHGRGVYQFNDGKKYIGYWKDNKKEGEGKTYYTNGNLESDCIYVKGQKNGIGSYYYSSGGKFEGIYKNNDYNGRGRKFKASGELEYDGYYVNGKMNGKGIYYYNRNTRWEGNFKDDELDGEGYLIDSSGKIYKMTYVMGKNTDIIKVEALSANKLIVFNDEHIFKK